MIGMGKGCSSRLTFSTRAAILLAKNKSRLLITSICSVGVSCSVAIAATRVRIPADAFCEVAELFRFVGGEFEFTTFDRQQATAAGQATQRTET